MQTSNIVCTTHKKPLDFLNSKQRQKDNLVQYDKKKIKLTNSVDVNYWFIFVLAGFSRTEQ